MSTYYQIFGGKINVISSDPTDPIEGQVFYNTTSEVLKYRAATAAGAWTSGGNMGTGRYFMGGAGTQTAGLAFTGETPGGNVTATEEYDGSSWAAGGNIATARQQPGGAGTQTSGLCFGGNANTPSPPAIVITGVTEEYDGTSWTSGGTMATARGSLAGCGTQTSALAFGGFISPATPNTAATEEYDGSSWTSGGNLGTSRLNLAGAGTQTSGLAFGGRDAAPVEEKTATEEYDGTSWTSGGNLNTARFVLAGAGTQTSALAFGGAAPPVTGATEEYNGTSWSNQPSMANARQALAGCGTQPAALAFGGRVSPFQQTEEFTGAGAGVTKTVTGS